MSAAPHVPAEPVLRCARLLRAGLVNGAGRSQLDGMLAEVAAELGYEALSILQEEPDGLRQIGSFGYGTDGMPPGEWMPLGSGIAGRALRTQAPALCSDSSSDPDWFDASSGRHRSGVAIPMRIVEGTCGVLLAESTRVDAFDTSDLSVLEPLADQLAWALQSVRLQQDARERAEREERLRRGLEASAVVITAGLEESSVEAALDRMVREIRDQLRWERVRVLLRDGEPLRVAAAHGYGSEGVDAAVGPLAGLVGKVAITGVARVSGDTSEEVYASEVGTGSEMAVPLKVAGVVRGVLHVEARERGRLTEDDLTVLRRIGQQMSLVMHNIELLASEKGTVARLHDLDQMKSRLLTIASHELRTPLTVVLGFAEVLTGNSAELPPEKVHEYAVAIQRQASSLGRLVDQMLLASQMEHGTISVMPAATALGDLLDQAVEEFDVPIEIGESAREITVMADPFRLRQVLSNLLGNAVKYASHGRIQLMARAEGGTATILLRDEGPGIPPEEQARVFDPFHQIGEHGVAGRRGVGLGLTVARDLVRLMDGDLKLVSAQGYGVTFTITLPLA